MCKHNFTFERLGIRMFIVHSFRPYNIYAMIAELSQAKITNLLFYESQALLGSPPWMQSVGESRGNNFNGSTHHTHTHTMHT